MYSGAVQPELVQAPEPRKAKKSKGRKVLTSSQRDNKALQSQSSKSSVDAIKFGQRQFSQPPS